MPSDRKLIRLELETQGHVSQPVCILGSLQMPLLANKIVCISGASRGIGRATASECARHGAAGLVLHYYGDEETTEEALKLQDDIQTEYPNCIVSLVAGDIALPDTSRRVSCYCTQKIWISRYTLDRRDWCRGIWENRYVLSQPQKTYSNAGMKDVLVSNAGICPWAEFLTMSPAVWDRTFQVNLDGAFYLVQGSCQMLIHISCP